MLNIRLSKLIKKILFKINENSTVTHLTNVKIDYNELDTGYYETLFK